MHECRSGIPPVDSPWRCGIALLPMTSLILFQVGKALFVSPSGDKIPWLNGEINMNDVDAEVACSTEALLFHFSSSTFFGKVINPSVFLYHMVVWCSMNVIIMQFYIMRRICRTFHLSLERGQEYCQSKCAYFTGLNSLLRRLGATGKYPPAYALLVNYICCG